MYDEYYCCFAKYAIISRHSVVLMESLSRVHINIALNKASWTLACN